MAERIVLTEAPTTLICDDDKNTIAVVAVTDDTIVPMGDGYAFRQITYTNNTPRYRLVFEVRDGIPGCVRIEIEGGESFLRAKDLAAIKIDDLRSEAFGLSGVDYDEHGNLVHRRNYVRDRKRVDQIKSRRKVTPDLLKRVAEIHNDAPEGARTEAIKSAFDVSTRTALRYVSLAKEKGLIGD
ncbi:hypothetical protein [Mycobacterium kyogaense]|uniref:hypothetical protein n=1 Tax=Mycobacterium kyogaense TaxID=2212479 RepID=UPI000DACEC61|nr:hypothetical protein [Mycobacterium kyogaense]